MRTRVYVDGFNLYYGALKATASRWLDPVRLSYLLIPDAHNIDKLRYFSARVSGKIDAGTPARQHAYLRALQSLPEVQLHMGRFLEKSAWRPLINLPVADQKIGPQEQSAVLPAGDLQVEDGRILSVGYNRPTRAGKKTRRASKPKPGAVIAKVYSMEEKGSDVNLGAFLLNDAWKGLFDLAVVISSDTDLVTPIRMVTVEQRKPVLVACPGRWEIAPQLRDVATHIRHIRPARRPEKWKFHIEDGSNQGLRSQKTPVSACLT